MLYCAPFCSALLCHVLFCFVLVCCLLLGSFCTVLFRSVLLISDLFSSVQFTFVLFRSVLLSSALSSSVQFTFVLFRSVRFILFCSVLFSSFLISSLLFCPVHFCSIMNDCFERRPTSIPGSRTVSQSLAFFVDYLFCFPAATATVIIYFQRIQVYKFRSLITAIATALESPTSLISVVLEHEFWDFSSKISLLYLFSNAT
jgi:hypothetical protein